MKTNKQIVKIGSLNKILLPIAGIALSVFQTSFAQQLWFGNSGTGNCPPYSVTFDIYSQPPGTDHYIWYFGDGTNPVTSSATSQSHTFNSGGNYEIILEAYDTSDVLLETASQDWFWIDGPGIQPSALFACPGDRIFFEARSTGNETILQWDFGDGTVVPGGMGGDRIDHTYADTGTFTVSLSMDDPSCGIKTVSRKITIGNNITPDLSWIDIWPQPVCPNDQVQLGTRTAGNFTWNFGDGNTDSGDEPRVEHVYDILGAYVFTVQVTNSCGLSDVGSDTVFVQGNVPVTDDLSYIDPQPNPACPGDPINFDCWDCGQNQKFESFSWDFGDGTYESVNGAVAHAYSSIGTKFPTLTIANGCGNTATFTYTVSIQGNLPVNTSNYFAAFAPDSACPGDNLMGLVSSGAMKYKWDFLDGTVDSTPDWVDNEIAIFYHIYNTTGNYNTTITITNGCGNSGTISNNPPYQNTTIFIGNNVDVQTVDFSEGPMGFGAVSSDNDGSYQTCATVEFIAFGGNSYAWNWGDGTTLTTPNSWPTHVWDTAGTYTVTLTTTNGCGNSETFTEDIVIQGACIYSCPFSVNSTTTDATCGNEDGSATAIADGGLPPYTYLWSDSAAQTTSTATGLGADFYTVQVMDANGCVVYFDADVSDAGLNIDYIAVDVSCYGLSDGSIDVTITGGTPPLTYEWSGGQSSQDLGNLPAGVYSLVVTDGALINKCIANENIIVDQPDDLNFYVLTNNAACSDSNGSAMAIVTGGTWPYTYNWSTGETDDAVNGLSAGNYSLTVTDTNGCVTTKTYSVNNTGGALVTITAVTDVTCSSPAIGAIDINVTGGTPPYTFSWSTGSSAQDISGLTESIYNLTVTDGAGCLSAFSQEIITALPSNPGICIVTVDSVTGKNIVVWEELPGIVSYNIYKEGTIADKYSLVGTVASTSQSDFTDPDSDPLIRSWRYRITAVDSCNLESEPSGTHKTIHIQSNLGTSDEVNLTWDGYEGFSFGTYYIYRSTVPGSPVLIDSVASTLFTYSDQSHPGGLLRYYLIAKKATPCIAQAKVKTYNASKSNTANQVAPVSIGETMKLNSSLVVFPNPAKDALTISSVNGLNFSHLSVLNLLGRSIIDIKSGTGNDFGMTIKINIGTLPQGIYILRFASPEGVEYRKFIKQ
ncbi:MAG: PKD domain-containing protein [Bacteroidetes bacterium]|nr:PKD domain-containing protein [Bacteroidota bacterium]